MRSKPHTLKLKVMRSMHGRRVSRCSCSMTCSTSCVCSWKRKPEAAIFQSLKCSPLPTGNWRLVMNRKITRRPPRLPRTYSEAQLAGIKRSTEERRLATVEQLQTAIEALKAKKQEISVQTIYDECGLRYAAIHRNPEALALFRANSTHLQEQKQGTKRKPQTADSASSPRDSLLNYKKPQLVERLRTAQHLLQTVEQQHS